MSEKAHEFKRILYALIFILFFLDLYKNFKYINQNDSSFQINSVLFYMFFYFTGLAFYSHFKFIKVKKVFMKLGKHPLMHKVAAANDYDNYCELSNITKGRCNCLLKQMHIINDNLGFYLKWELRFSSMSMLSFVTWNISKIFY